MKILILFFYLVYIISSTNANTPKIAIIGQSFGAFYTLDKLGKTYYKLNFTLLYDDEPFGGDLFSYSVNPGI